MTKAARHVAIAATWVAIVLLHTACARETGGDRAVQRVRAVLSSDPSSLTLVGKTDRNGETLAFQISEGLVRYDENLVLQPRVARSWEVSGDGRTWTFHLRDGVRWHDGVPVTADDVVFTIEKVRDPATQSRSYMAAFQDLAAVEAVDPRTVRATYVTPYADALDSWTLPLLPRHLAGKDPDLLTGEFSRHPVGCGPFRFVRAEAGKEIVLAANDDYWDGRPRMDEIVFRILRDDRTRFQALLRGEIDLLGAPNDLWRAAREPMREGRLAGFVSYRLDVWYVGWNQSGSNPFFVDAGVRRAMVLALDRKRFISAVLDGYALPAVGSYHPKSRWFDETLEPWPYDPAEATRLLEAAGWTDSDGDGVRDRKGVPFSFALLVPALSQEVTDRIAIWMQDSWKSVGIRATIDKLEWSAFQERRVEHRFQAAMASMNFTPVPDQYELYHSSSREHGLNYVGFHDEAVDALLEEGRRTFDPAARKLVYAKLERRLHELEPISCLFHLAAPLLHDVRLQGLRPTPLGLWLTTPGPRAWYWADSRPGS